MSGSAHVMTLLAPNLSSREADELAFRRAFSKDRIDRGDPVTLLGEEFAGLSEIVGAVEATSAVPWREAALAASLTLVGATASRGYSVGRTYPAHYQLLVGAAGAGKTEIAKAAERLLEVAGCAYLSIGNDVTAATALHRALRGHPRALWVADEAGEVLRPMISRKADPSAQEKMRVLKELASAQDSVYRPKHFSRVEDTCPPIFRPGLVWLGLTTPSQFEHCVTQAAAEDGFLARTLVIQLEAPPRPRRGGVNLHDPRVVAAAERLSKIDSIARNGMLAARRWVKDQDDGSPWPGEQDVGSPVSVRVEQTADARLELIGDEAYELALVADRLQRYGPASLIRRTPVSIERLAMLSAIARSPEAPEIQLSDVAFAEAYVRRHVGRLVLRLESHHAETPFERRRNAVLAQIESAGPDGLTRGALAQLRPFKSLKRRDRDELIATLLDDGLIEHVRLPSAGRSATLYKATPADRMG